MPQCAFHPDVETSLRCAECERYICPKDMVTTPVGYKCRECATPAAGQLRGATARQFALACAAGLGSGILGGLVLGQIHFGSFLLALVFGMLVGEATRRGSGGHRLPSVAGIAAVSAALGALIGGFGFFGLVLAPIAAFVTVTANSFI